jgi:hypothetical protein
MRVASTIARLATCLVALASSACGGAEAMSEPVPFVCQRGGGDGGVEGNAGGCTEYVDGYSESDARSVCASPNALLSDTACASGWRYRCEVSVLGREARSYWYEAASAEAATGFCSTLSGSLTRR